MTKPKNRQPAGQPTGGQFAAQQHSEPPLALQPQKTMAFSEDASLLDHLSASGIGGSSHTSGHETVVWESADGSRSFEVAGLESGGYEVTDLESGEARTAYDAAFVPGEIKAGIARAAGKEIAPFDREKFDVTSVGFWNEPTPDGAGGQAHVNIDLLSRDGAYTDLHYFTGEQRLEIWRGGELLDGEEFEAAADDVCPERRDGEPEGSPAGRLAWHAERILNRVAARDDVPDWMLTEHRVDGVTFER